MSFFARFPGESLRSEWYFNEKYLTRSPHLKENVVLKLPLSWHKIQFMAMLRGSEMLFLSVAGFNISIYHCKIKFDITSMISWEKFGIQTEYFNENYLTAVKRARIITTVFSAEDSVDCFCSST